MEWIYILDTVICEKFVGKKFCLMQNDENSLREIFLLVILYTVNMWHAFDMNENIVTRNFIASNFTDSPVIY